jgi:hypothetical protein
MPIAIDLTGAKQDIEAIFTLAKRHSEVTDVSEPTNLDASSPLNVGLPMVSPTDVLTFLTLVFTTGKAALEFLKALRDLLKTKGGAVAVSESATGKPLGQLEQGTSDQALTRLASQ